MEEVGMTSVYVLERKDGTILTWNCEVDVKIYPAEDVVVDVHLDLTNEFKTVVHLGSDVKKQSFKGMGWIGKPAFPDEFHIPADEPPRMIRD